MNWYKLAYPSKDIFNKIADFEKKGDFNSHLDDCDPAGSLPVTAKFPYVPGPWLRFVYWFRHFYFLNSFTKGLNTKVYHTQIIGREKLDKVAGAVITCNHYNIYDGLVAKWVFGKKQLKIMTADFNNRDGLLGKWMRASGIMPFSTKRDVVVAFTKAVEYHLKQGTSILFFPEGSEWWCYEKPRPLMDGAFHYAVSNNVPVVPMFVTFKLSGVKNSDGIEMRHFTVHILDPIYPDPKLNKRENVTMLKAKNAEAWKKTYEKTYNKELTYN
jgi:1-acyl-sn-glycerol-3-phosphate acyltransferase